MIFSYNQKLALQLLNYKFYISRDNEEEILVLDKVSLNDEIIVKPTTIVENNAENLTPTQLLPPDSVATETEEEQSLIAIFDNLNQESKTIIEEEKEAETFITETIISSDEDKIPAFNNLTNSNLKTAEELGFFANLDLTIINYKNISLFFPPLLLKGNSYKFYNYEYELTIWEKSLTLCGLGELWDFLQTIFLSNFAKPNNLKLTQDVNADLIVIFANEKIRKLADKFAIPSIYLRHPAQAAANQNYKKAVWQDFQLKSKTIKKYLDAYSLA